MWVRGIAASKKVTSIDPVAYTGGSTIWVSNSYVYHLFLEGTSALSKIQSQPTPTELYCIMVGGGGGGAGGTLGGGGGGGRVISFTIPGFEFPSRTFVAGSGGLGGTTAGQFGQTSTFAGYIAQGGVRGNGRLGGASGANLTSGGTAGPFTGGGGGGAQTPGGAGSGIGPVYGGNGGQGSLLLNFGGPSTTWNWGAGGAGGGIAGTIPGAQAPDGGAASATGIGVDPTPGFGGGGGGRISDDTSLPGFSGTYGGLIVRYLRVDLYPPP